MFCPSRRLNRKTCGCLVLKRSAFSAVKEVGANENHLIAAVNLASVRRSGISQTSEFGGLDAY